MAAPLRFPEMRATLPIELSDASCLPRMGVKGPQAESGCVRKASKCRRG